MKNKKLKEDSMIKSLIRDYPIDALEYLKPSVISEYGIPTKVTFHIQEKKKYSHEEGDKISDLVVLYEFSNEKKVVLSLIEHWSNKNKFDIHRFANYLINLDFQFPDYEKIPIALFTDQKEWHKEPQKEIRIECLGETYLNFKYELVKLKDDDATRYKTTKNKFIAVLRTAMKFEELNKVLFAIEAITLYNKMEDNLKTKIRNFEILDYYLNVTEEEKNKITELLENDKDKSMIFDAILEKGIEKGIDKRDTGIVLKLNQKNYSLEQISEITDLSIDKIKKILDID